MKKLSIKYKILQVIIIILLIIIVLLFIMFLFLKLYIPFGESPSIIDMEDYKKRALNYKNGKFYNENEFEMIYRNNEKNTYLSDKNTKPIENIPIKPPMILDNPKMEELNITWLGHSTILMNISGMNILIDPVFSEHASPVSFFGPSRYSDLPIEIEKLPDIDIVVISHDHYDHLDYKTIKFIDEKVSKYIVPLGIENHLERWNINTDKITNMAWWEEVNINGLLIGCTPARHYSSRTMLDKYNTLWASYVFIDNYHKVFISGDSGYANHFKDINKKYGDFDISLLDTGQYNVKWKSTHMIPEQSVQAGIDLNSKVIMPIHNSSFVLASHPWDDPLERFVTESEKKNIKYITPMIGETINYSDDMSTSNWWRKIR